MEKNSSFACLFLPTPFPIYFGSPINSLFLFSSPSTIYSSQPTTPKKYSHTVDGGNLFLCFSQTFISPQHGLCFLHFSSYKHSHTLLYSFILFYYILKESSREESAHFTIILLNKMNNKGRNKESFFYFLKISICQNFCVFVRAGT